MKDAPLSRAIGISHTTVKRIRTGESEPTAGIIAAFAKHTGVNAHWLLTGQGKPYILPEDIPPELPGFLCQLATDLQDIANRIQEWNERIS